MARGYGYGMSANYSGTIVNFVILAVFVVVPIVLIVAGVLWRKSVLGRAAREADAGGSPNPAEKCPNCGSFKRSRRWGLVWVAAALGALAVLTIGMVFLGNQNAAVYQQAAVQNGLTYSGGPTGWLISSIAFLGLGAITGVAGFTSGPVRCAGCGQAFSRSH